MEAEEEVKGGKESEVCGGWGEEEKVAESIGVGRSEKEKKDNWRGGEMKR